MLRGRRRWSMPSWLPLAAFGLFLAVAGTSNAMAGYGLRFAVVAGPYWLGWISPDTAERFVLTPLWVSDLFISRPGPPERLPEPF